jgi:hypothetical protein
MNDLRPKEHQMPRTLAEQSAQTLDSMRDWIADCDPFELECYEDARFLLDETPDAQILTYVERHYHLGVVGFLIDQS